MAGISERNGRLMSLNASESWWFFRVHSIQTQPGSRCIYEFIIFLYIISTSCFTARREKRERERERREMIVIQGHGSKEVYPQEQIQNILCNRIATPK